MSSCAELTQQQLSEGEWCAGPAGTLPHDTLNPEHLQGGAGQPLLSPAPRYLSSLMLQTKESNSSQT